MGVMLCEMGFDGGLCVVCCLMYVAGYEWALCYVTCVLIVVCVLSVA